MEATNSARIAGGSEQTTLRFPGTYRRRRASRSHSIRVRISPSRTGPYRITLLAPPPYLDVSDNGTLGSIHESHTDLPITTTRAKRTWVTLPVLPVLPRTLSTTASLTSFSYAEIRINPLGSSQTRRATTDTALQPNPTMITINET